MNTLILFLDVYSRVCLPSVSPLCSTCPTRTRWISPHSETFRDFMLHSNCKWSTEPHGRYAELNLPIYDSPSDFFSVFDWCFDPQPLCLFFTDSAFAVLVEFKPGSGHAARQWREHRFRGHSQWSGCWSIALLLARRAWWWFFFNTASALCLLTDPAQSEVMGEPHVMVEYKLGLLWKILQDTQLTLWLLLLICVLWIKKKPKQKQCSVLHLYDSSLTFISIKLWELSWKYLFFHYVLILVCLTV